MTCEQAGKLVKCSRTVSAVTNAADGDLQRPVLTEITRVRSSQSRTGTNTHLSRSGCDLHGGSQSTLRRAGKSSMIHQKHQLCIRVHVWQNQIICICKNRKDNAALFKKNQTVESRGSSSESRTHGGLSCVLEETQSTPQWCWTVFEPVSEQQLQ